MWALPKAAGPVLLHQSWSRVETQSAPTGPRLIGVLSLCGMCVAGLGGDLDAGGRQRCLVLRHDRRRELVWVRRRVRSKPGVPVRPRGRWPTSSRCSAPGSLSPISCARYSAPVKISLIVRISASLFANIDCLRSWVRSSVSAGVLLVCGLPADAERLGDLRPGPSLVDRARDGVVLQLVGESPQGHHGGQCIGRVVRPRVGRFAAPRCQL